MGLWNRLGSAQERLFNRRANRAESKRRTLIAKAELYERMAELSVLDGTAQGEGTSEWALGEAKRLRLEADLI